MPRANTTASWLPPPRSAGDSEFSLDVPNGLSSRCACDFQSPPACSCGGDLPSDPKADPGSINKLGSVGAIAYSPDGALFAVSHGERVFLLDASTLRERFHLEGHTAFVRALVFGPDGKTLISGADDRTSRRWDLATGKELSRLTSDGAGITALAFAPDGTWVAAGSGHGTFFAWDPTSSKEVREASNDRCNVGPLAFSADGKTLVAGVCSEGMVLFEAPWFTQRARLERVLGLGGTGAAWSPDKRILAFCSGREGLWLSEPDAGTKRKLAADVRGLVAFAPDGKSLATSTPGAFFDLATGQRRAFAGHRHGVHAMVYSPDGKTLATSGEYDGAVRFWDATTGSEVRAIRRHSPAVRALALSPDGASLASAWGDGKVRLLDLASGKVRWMGETGTYRENALAFSPDGRSLASFGAPASGRLPDEVLSSRILVWDVMAGTLATQIDEAPDARFSGGLAWSRDGKVLATGGGQQVLRWGMPGWKPMVPLSTWCSNDGLKACVVREVAWSPDGRALLAGARGPTRRWDAVSGAEQKGARTPAMAVAHPGDGGWLDLIDRTSEARPKALWSTLNLVASTAYQPGGGAVAVGRKDMTVSLLDGAGERVLAVLRGHAGVVSAVAWTRDGRVLISGGDDGEIRFWSADGRALAVLRVVEGTPDSYVFTEGSDARIEVFGAAAARVPLCRDGRETSPFEACAGRFSASGLLSAALRP